MTSDQDRFDHDRMEEAVAAYVLDALEGEERAQVRAHIDGCPSCMVVMRRLAHAADGLPLAVDDVRPPDRLRERILAIAAVTPAGQEDAPRALPRIIPLPVRPSLAQGPPAAAPAGGGRARLVAWGVAVGLLVAGLGVLSALAVHLNNELQQANRRAAQAVEQARQPSGEYALSGTGSMAGASGTVQVFRNEDAALVSLAGLPALDSGMVYQLWVIEPRKDPVSGGVFTPDGSGNSTLKVTGPLKVETVIAVTQESGPRGARQPTQKPELTGRL